MSTQLTVKDMAEKLGMSSSGVLAQVRSTPREGKVTLAVAAYRLGKYTMFDAVGRGVPRCHELRRRSVADAQDASSSHSVALIKAMSPPYEP